MPIEKGMAIGDIMNAKEFLQYMRSGVLPICPAGGQYIISWIVGGPYPRCSVHGDLLQKYCGDRTFRVGVRKKGTAYSQTFSRDPMARRPYIHKPPRTYVSGIDLGLPNLMPLKRVATDYIGAITNSDPDLQGHVLDFHAIRYEHWFIQSERPTGITYIAVYRDSTLRNGNATGVDIDVRDNIANFKSQKGLPLFSAPLDGEVEVPEQVLKTIALAAVTNFWLQMDANRLLIEEIICCDPIGNNDYSVNFRLGSLPTEPTAGGGYTRIEVDVTTNGNVRENEIEWIIIPGTNATVAEMTGKEKEQ
jgi:hypothetical protein